MDWHVPTSAGPLVAAPAVPPSKSILQRVLLLGALSASAPRLVLGGARAGDDVLLFERALAALGRWEDGVLGRSRERLAVDLGRNATGLRFAVAASTLRLPGARTLVRGHPTLLARPHGVLRRALVRLGGHVVRRGSGALRVLGGGVRGGRLTIRADVSSQFGSALLLIAPRIGGLDLGFAGRPVSRPYLDVTVDVLRRFGVPAETEGLDGTAGRIRVAAAEPSAVEAAIEPDASAAAVWWTAAALTGGRASIAGLPRGTLQADGRLLDVLERMGAQVETGGDGGVTVRGPAAESPGEVDLGDAPDLLPLVAVLAARARGTTRIRGVAHARFKESDRLASVAAGLARVGVEAEILPDGLSVRGPVTRPGVVDAAGDHRIVLAFGALGLVQPGVVVAGAEAVSKSWPSFPSDLEAAVRPIPRNGPTNAVP